MAGGCAVGVGARGWYPVSLLNHDGQVDERHVGGRPSGPVLRLRLPMQRVWV